MINVWGKNELEDDEPKISLIVGNEKGQLDANTPVRFCLNREALMAVKKKDVTAAWVLISVVDDLNRETARHLLPVEQVMQYVQFNRPGRNRLCCLLLTSEAGKTTLVRIRKNLLIRGKHGYKVNTFQVIDNEFEFAPLIEMLDGVKIIAQEEVAVEVSPEFFAKEPPVWLKKWAYLLWKKEVVGGPDNTCLFKKHILFSVFVQPEALVGISVVAAILILFRAVWAFIALAVGMRFDRNGYGVDWKAIFRPLGDWDDIWDCDFHPCWDELAKNLGGSYLLYDKRGKRRTFANYWVTYAPAIWICVYGVSFALCHWVLGYAAKTHPFAIAAQITTAAFLLFAVLPPVIFLIALGVAMLTRLFSPSFKRWVSERINRLEKEEEEVLREKMAARERTLEASTHTLLCDFVPKRAPRLEDLPKRTVKLRVQKLKAHFCRPYPT